MYMLTRPLSHFSICPCYSLSINAMCCEGGAVIAVLVLGTVIAQSELSQQQEELCRTKPGGLTCVLPENILNSTIVLVFYAGQNVQIIPSNSSGDLMCTWTHGVNNMLYSLENPFIISVDHSGNYTLECERNSIRSSFSISLLVRPAHGSPTTPQIHLKLRTEGFTPNFHCVSEGVPAPDLLWFNSPAQKDEGSEGERQSKQNGRTETTVKSRIYSQTAVMCCAKNNQGEQCSQLFDYDMDKGFSLDEAPEITVRSGQSLLLRCRAKNDTGKLWLTNITRCTGEEQVCKGNYAYPTTFASFLYFKSINVNNTGMYTCMTDNGKTKSVRVKVFDGEFIHVQARENITIPAHQEARFCLQASVSSIPALRLCYWTDPRGNQFSCPKSSNLWQNSTPELCGVRPGVYNLYLEAGGLKHTTSMSLCVADSPVIQLYKDGENFICKTNMAAPMTLAWMACPLSENSCLFESESAPWKEINASSLTQYFDSDKFCHKRVLSSLNSTSVTTFSVKCCIANSVQSLCSSRLFDLIKPSFQHSTQHTPSSALLKVGSMVLIVALMLVTIALLYFIRKKKPQYQSQLQMIQMIGPNDNDYIYISFKDFEYDQKWEFPRANLELGKELGSGAFGKVVQATAYGISKPEVSCQVAVKMLKEKHQQLEKEALMSELKMLTHIGHHANIVNLLGACTNSGPVYLIFQYCCHGDLLNYMKTNRERYHKSLTEAFISDRFTSLYHNVQDQRSASELEAGSYASLLGLPPEMTQEEGQALTYDDLLSFAYQVAQGMDFLSSKNCIHRDLAARNVMVTQGQLVKIGDFGLARDIDNDSNYVVRGNVRLPVKWMAPESVFHGIYTMQSDVWAYGILLWEIFSLGVTPYPGVKVDTNFYVMIQRGFKMEQPYYASDSVYRMMCDCWALGPSDRPVFSKLVAFMVDQMTDVEEKLYQNIIDNSSHDSLSQNATVILSALDTEREDPLELNQYSKRPSDPDSMTVEDQQFKPDSAGLK